MDARRSGGDGDLRYGQVAVTDAEGTFIGLVAEEDIVKLDEILDETGADLVVVGVELLGPGSVLRLDVFVVVDEVVEEVGRPRSSASTLGLLHSAGVALLHRGNSWLLMSQVAHVSSQGESPTSGEEVSCSQTTGRRLHSSSTTLPPSKVSAASPKRGG